jgi:hypothetical protein
MSNKEPVNLPFLWEFFPVEESRDKSIRWKWRAVTHSGKIAMQSKNSFENRTECTADAAAHGYRGTSQ